MYFSTTLTFGFLYMYSRLTNAALTNSNSTVPVNNTSKYVIAHFMVGIVPNYVVADWKQDMAYAQEIGIDAFALNCACTRVDNYTPKQLANAYEAARQMNFRVLISFDFAYWNSGDTAEITGFMNQYAGHPAQLKYNGNAIVSTFVGDNFDWGPVKAGTTEKLFAIPNQVDPRGSSYLRTQFDGVFSWYAWPTIGDNIPTPARMTTFWDDIFISNLAGRPYMAPVSPWFSPHFANKNWVFICEQLITDRWNQILTMKPELLQIISWNDYGEGHYIAPWEPNHSDDGSSQWTYGFPHDGWRLIMKPYIAAYKSGAITPTVTKDQLVYWYRPTPKNTVCTGDPVGPSNGYQYLGDYIFVTTMLTSPATLTVHSGTKANLSIDVPAGIVTTNFTMDVGAQLFYLQRNGMTIMSGRGGRDIVDNCTFYNFNAYVGSLDTSSRISLSTSVPSPTVTRPSTSRASISSTGTRSTSSRTSTLITTSSMTKTSSSKQTLTSTTRLPTTSSMRTSSKTKSSSSSSTRKITSSTSSRTTSTKTPTTTRTTSPVTSSSTTRINSTTTRRTSTSGNNIASRNPSSLTTRKSSSTTIRATTRTATARKTSTTSATSPSSSSGASSSTVCYEGSGQGNYIGLCQFACSYGYCPPGPCTCTVYVAREAARTTPPANGRKGYPNSGLDASYLGLCDFACAHNYCPSTACYYV